MASVRKEQRYIIEFKVRVSGIGGVLDMMRYDQCYPASQRDSAKLERIASHNDSAEDHVVTFIKSGQAPRIDVQRWASFNCQVLDPDFASENR